MGEARLPALSLANELERDSQLYSLWLDAALCDCILAANDGTTQSAHKVVLAACSPFFKALFTGAWRDQEQQQQSPTSGLPRWSLRGVDGASLHLLLHAIYSKRLPVTGESAADDVALLLAASNYLEVLPVKAACCQFLRSQLSLETVAETLALAAAHDCTELGADAARFFEGHFAQLLKSEHAASLAVLPPDLLRQLLSSDGLNTHTELDVARATLMWAAADPDPRAPLLSELLPAARMLPGQLAEDAARCGMLHGAGSDQHSLLQPRQQEQEQQQEQQQQQRRRQEPLPQQQQQAAFQQQQPWLDLQQLAPAFLTACRQLQHIWAAVEASGEGAPLSFRPRLSCPTGLMMAGGLDDGWRPLRTVELYCPQKDCWSAGPLMPAPCSFAAASILGQQTYVVEGAAHAPSVLAFDRQQRRWRLCQGLATPRVNMAVAALEEQLYVLGGRAGIGKGAAVLRDVEVYSPDTDSWHATPPMAAPRTSLAAAALGGRLYAVGGQDSRSTHGGTEVFEPGAGRWVPLSATMHQPRKYLGLAAAGGRLVAVGGMTAARMRLPAAEALDPREGRWQALPPMTVARSSAGVAALHECVYVVGGNVGMGVNENHAGVEVWVPAAGRWRSCSPMSHGRSGLSVVAPALSTRALPPRTLSTRASMGKGDLIKHVAAEADLTAAAADRAVNALLDVIMDKVAKGEKVAITGFGSFEPRARAARVGRNPQTGAELQIAASVAPGFSAGKSFKDRVKAAAPK
ncbi:Kelch-like protein 10 [Chlorella vulgaris]